MIETKNNSEILREEVLTAEHGVLGSMLIDEETVGPVMMTVAEEDFLHEQCRHIFQVIHRRFAEGKPVDVMLVASDLGDPSLQPFLIQIMDVTPTSANVLDYAEALKKSNRLYRLQALGREMAQAADVDECQEIIDRANLLLCQRQKVKRLTMEEGFRQFFLRHDTDKPPEYLKWGLGGLDDEIHVGHGDMVVIGGHSSSGKTALALQMAFTIAQKQRVGFFSYETADEKLYDRMTACQTQISFRQIMTGKLAREDFKRVYDLREHLTGPKLDFIEAYEMTVSSIGAFAAAYHYDVIVVDYLQKIPAAKGGRPVNEFERVSRISSDLQQLGRSTGKTIVALSQLSRMERRKDGSILPPTMSSLRQSGQIEQDADVVMLLYKEIPDAPLSRRVLDVAKNKDGESGLHMMLDFDGDKQRFSKAPETYIPPSKRVPEAQTSFFKPMPDREASPWDERNGGMPS